MSTAIQLLVVAVIVLMVARPVRRELTRRVRKHVRKLVRSQTRTRRFNQRTYQSVSQARPGQGPRLFTGRVREYILRRDGYKCTNCGSTQRLEVDHIIPYSKGGKTVPSNGKTLCHICNQLKSNLFEE